MPDDARFILDVSGIANWLGPAVGIVRVEQELAVYAASHHPDIILAVFDGETFRPLALRWRDTLLGWRGAIDRSGSPQQRVGWRRFVPSRYPIVMALERRRSRRPDSIYAFVLGRLQDVLLSIRKHNTPLTDAAGKRFTIVPFADALAAPVTLTPHDTVMMAGAHRFARQVDAIAALQRRVGFRLVALCYDLIPLLFPHWYENADVAVFRHHWATLFPICQTVLITSAAVERDVKAHCDEYGIKTSLTRVPLGYNPPADWDDAPLPAGLEPGRFALFVATLEPRKGHAVLVAAWRILLARGLPQRQQFRLVFVGRAGWKVGALLQDLTDPALDGTLIHLPSVDDAGLATLYQQAAFCVYPSLYEGFGLPLVESFAYGKPVIASTGGSVPEIAATFCPCLDPQDVDAWAEAIARWITNPEEPAAIAARLRNEFRHPNWAEAANLILLAARP